MGVLTIPARLSPAEKSTGRARTLGSSSVGFMERAAALLMLLALGPIVLIAALVTAVLSRDSPFVSHARVGRGGKPIRVVKLRTMWGTGPSGRRLFIEHLDNTVVPESKTRRDPRVTSSFAAFCRRHSIDEIPQLWQVVIGEMALVGPRPLTAIELNTYYSGCTREVLSVAPGITGLWQVAGRSSLTYWQRRSMDLFLVRKLSAGLYLFILTNTVKAVLTGRNAA